MTISILGGGGQTYGLAASADIRDIWSIYDTGPMSLPFSHLYGPAISLTFVADREVPPATRREVKAARWEVADRNAQPDLAVVNTPGCGISRAQARDLVDLLWAVPRFVDQHRALLEQHQVLPESIAWRDAESGVEIEFSGSLFPEGIVTWPLPETLAPCTAEGPGAEPEAALTMPEDPDDLVAQETAVVERFERWLAERGDDERACEEHADTASSFVESFLAGYQGVPLRAVTEYDLRMFLYEWYPRKVQDTDDGAAALPGSLARFFEFVEAEEGIDCPWAAEITADEERFVDRWRACPGTFWWDEGVGAWRQLIYPDLDARLMLADDIGEGDETATGLGVVEATLERELQRRWLLWRDEAIRSGVTAPLSVREALLNRQREWERARQDALSGKTPLQAVREERQAQARRERRERADPER